jgi:hypothetical protein
MTARKFHAEPAVLAEVPLLIGLIGPPGGGKTYSALRLAKGMQQVRPGPIVLIDTERGRASKYANSFEFMRVNMEPPFKPEDFLDAVRAQLPSNPAAIIVDSLSDEHEGDGGVLDWHDQEVPRMGGNEWAAWSKPKASRRKMINGFLQIKTPLIFTFRAREKTKTELIRGKNTPVNIGYQPIAPSEVIYALDLTCILPPRAEGVPIWKSDKIGEDFIIKLPSFLRHCFKDGALDENTGEQLARWAKGSTQTPVPNPPHPAADVTAPASTSHSSPAGAVTGGLSVEDMGKEAAMRGKDLFDKFYDSQDREAKAKLRAIKPEIEKLFPAANVEHD